MLFNNPVFILFLATVYLLYWRLNRRAQNVLLLAASYFFYACWDYRFLSLLMISTLTDYVIALLIDRTDSAPRRKMLIVISMCVSLGLLGFFKYFNFFVDSLEALLQAMGFQAGGWRLHILLPIGISFYTFQTINYTIDVYRRHMKPTRNLVEFAAFVSFFPHLVAGPIMRANNLLPQFEKERTFNPAEAADGIRQMVWGLFKKVVIADALAPFVNQWYGHVGAASGWQLLIGTYFFAFQIYCDFSGYSDIAVGCAKLLGFSLIQNFRYPYFSQDLREFWARWHVSLTTWFRDYLYIPLGGSRGSHLRTQFNVMMVFFLSGLWHGANWTFVFWGVLNGVIYLLTPERRKQGASRYDIPGGDTLLPSPRVFLKMVFTFHLVLLTWVFFRAVSFEQAFTVLLKVCEAPLPPLAEIGPLLRPVFFIGILLFAEWFGRRQPHSLALVAAPQWVRAVLVLATAAVIVLWGSFVHVPFIYFQF